MFLLWNLYPNHNGWGTRRPFERHNRLESSKYDRLQTNGEGFTLMFRWLFWFRFDEQLSFEADLLLVLHSHTKKCSEMIQFLSHVSVQQSHVPLTSTEMWMYRFKEHHNQMKIHPTPRRRNSLRPIHGSLRLPYIDRPSLKKTKRESEALLFHLSRCKGENMGIRIGCCSIHVSRIGEEIRRTPETLDSSFLL